MTILLTEFDDDHVAIRLVCRNCGRLLREGFDDGAGLACEYCGHTVSLTEATRMIAAVHAEAAGLLETLREAQAG